LEIEPKGKATPALLTRAQLQQVKDLWATKDDRFGLLLQKYKRACERMPARGHKPSLAQWEPKRGMLTDREKIWKTMKRDITV
jgi:hypothetical protein